MVIDKHVCFFLHPALAQTMDYTRFNYTCTHFLIYDTAVHTWNKWSSVVKHDVSQAGMKVDTWGYEIISSKHLVGKCVLNGRDNIVKRFRRVTRDRQTEGKRERDRQTETQRQKGVREGETHAHTHTHFNALSLTETESLVVSLIKHIPIFLPVDIYLMINANCTWPQSQHRYKYICFKCCLNLQSLFLSCMQLKHCGSAQKQRIVQYKNDQSIYIYAICS